MQLVKTIAANLRFEFIITKTAPCGQIFPHDFTEKQYTSKFIVTQNPHIIFATEKHPLTPHTSQMRAHQSLQDFLISTSSQQFIATRSQRAIKNIFSAILFIKNLRIYFALRALAWFARSHKIQNDSCIKKPPAKNSADGFPIQKTETIFWSIFLQAMLLFSLQVLQFSKLVFWLWLPSAFPFNFVLVLFLFAYGPSAMQFLYSKISWMLPFIYFTPSFTIQ